jgi:hypothetical protein
MREHRAGHRHAGAIRAYLFEVTSGTGDKVGNPRRGGSLERGKPTPWSKHPVGHSLSRPSGLGADQAREGSSRSKRRYGLGGEPPGGAEPQESSGLRRVQPTRRRCRIFEGSNTLEAIDRLFWPARRVRRGGRKRQEGRGAERRTAPRKGKALKGRTPWTPSVRNKTGTGRGGVQGAKR